MPERIVQPGETVLQALSFASSLLIVQTAPEPKASFECRGCLILAVDCSRSVTGMTRTALIDHLDQHREQDHAGAKDALWKAESCGTCRSTGMARDAAGSLARCEPCAGRGLNEIGRKRDDDRRVRRGVLVG